jgi:glyoxylate utilization-related uncharacterized protein
MLSIQPSKWRNAERAIIQKDWNARGFSCELCIDPPGQHWDNQINDVDELLTPLNAAIEIEWEGETMLLDPGDEWFIPRNSYFSVRNTCTETVRWLYGYKKQAVKETSQRGRPVEKRI